MNHTYLRGNMYYSDLEQAICSEQYEIISKQLGED